MSNNTSPLQDMFGDIKVDTIRRNTQRSVSWLRNKIKKAGDALKTIPRVGGMYLYVYDAKHKDKLPFWDAAPLIIPVAFVKGGFYGINFHYLPVSHRKILFKLLGGMNSGKTNYIRISYDKLLGLSNTIWKNAFKRYLYSHVRSRFVQIPKDEWENALELPTSSFQKQTARQVQRRSIIKG